VAVEITSRRAFACFGLNVAETGSDVDMVHGEVRNLLSLRGWRFVGRWVVFSLWQVHGGVDLRGDEDKYLHFFTEYFHHQSNLFLFHLQSSHSTKPIFVPCHF
jgi:hypothetical protein